MRRSACEADHDLVTREQRQRAAFEEIAAHPLERVEEPPLALHRVLRAGHERGRERPEAEAVLVSYGVSDPEFAQKEAEFIYGLNRLNVAITRARSKTILCLPRPLLDATPQVLDYLRPWTDCYKIDLKSMNDKNYRQLGGVVDNILDTVKMVHERGFWEEIVTLVIPGFNDSEDELRRAAEFIASVSPDIPWHVTAFHQDYRMTENSNTTAAQLIRACEIGREAGLNYIYAGNLPGRVGRWENTYCPSCDELLVERFGYLIRQVNVTSQGRCPTCSTVIPGIWK